MSAAVAWKQSEGAQIIALNAYRSVEAQRDLALRVKRAERERLEEIEDANLIASVIMLAALVLAAVVLRGGVGLLAWMFG